MIAKSRQNTVHCPCCCRRHLLLLLLTAARLLTATATVASDGRSDHEKVFAYSLRGVGGAVVLVMT